jgi:hypothetical protein
MQLQFLILGLLLSLFTVLAQANTEKTIFLAPPATTIPSEQPDFDDLGLERLSPQAPIVRTRLNASFPTSDAPEGVESWFFLENLNPGQRYEVRVCWLATVRIIPSLTPILVYDTSYMYQKQKSKSRKKGIKADETSNRHPSPFQHTL